MVLSPVVANLAALALQLATTADTSRLPAAVAPLRDHPWLGYVVLTAASAVIAVFAWRRDRGTGNRHTHANVPLQAAADLAMSASPSGGGHIRPPTGDLPTLRGRDAEIARLHHLRRHSPRRLHILSGLGGCGKTTVALAFAAQMIKRGVTVWWVRADDQRSFVEGMLAVAAAAGAPDAAVQRSRQQGSAEIAWQILAQRDKPYLLVIDGADDPALLGPAGHTAVVSGRHAFVLVTSRVVEHDSWGREAEVLPLPALSPAAAAQILLDRIPRRAASAAGETAARVVAERLGCLPLALHLAGRYLGSGVVDADLTRYVQVLDRESVHLVDIAAGEAEQQVFDTWEVSLAALEATGNTRARRLLRYLSMFSAGQPIPVELADWRVLHRTGLLTDDPEAAHDVQFRALNGLKKFGLLQPVDNQEPTYKDIAAVVVHRLVAEVSLLRLADEGERPDLLLTAAATALHEACDGLDAGEPGLWPVWQLLVPHASALLDRLELARGGALNEVLEAVDLFVRQLCTLGLYAVARDLATRAAGAAERFGAADPALLLTAQHALALVCFDCGDFDEAHRLHLQVLAASAADTAMTVTTMHHLGRVLQAQGHIEKAEDMLRGVVRRLGDDSPDTMAARHDLASTLHATGKFAEAERLLREVLEHRTARLGPAHPDTLATMHSLATRANIAWVLLLQGRYRKSNALFQEVLARRIARLGPDHPDTLTTRGNIAWLRNEQGKHDEAEALLRQLITDRERVLGADHPRTLTTRHNLAQALRAQHKLVEADAIFTDVLQRQQAKLGEANPSTLSTKHNLALLRQEQGRLAEAQQLLEEVLAAQVEQFGENHPDVAKTRANLAAVLRRRGGRRLTRRGAGGPWPAPRRGSSPRPPRSGAP